MSRRFGGAIFVALVACLGVIAWDTVSNPHDMGGGGMRVG